MQVAINYSPEAAVLLREGRIEIDIFKCSDWDELVTPAQELKPAYVHFPITLGRGDGNPTVDDINAWLARTQTPFVNAHIGAANDDFPDDISIEALTDALLAELQPYVDAFSAERVIIENQPFGEFDKRRGERVQAMNPQVFQRLIAETGCGLLLDIAHATLTCENTDYDLRDYIAALPVAHLRELHISGIGAWHWDDIRGDHRPLTEADWEVVDWASEQIAAGAWAMPQTVAFEHGGIGRLKAWCGSDKAAIARDMPRLYERFHRLHRDRSTPTDAPQPAG